MNGTAGVPISGDLSKDKFHWSLNSSALQTLCLAHPQMTNEFVKLSGIFLSVINCMKLIYSFLKWKDITFLLLMQR